VTDASEGKYKLLEVELWHYFGETCPVLVARWEAAIRGLAPPFLRELQGRLQGAAHRCIDGALAIGLNRGRSVAL